MVNQHACYITGKSASRDFSAIVLDSIPNLHLQDSGQGFTKYIFDKEGLFEGASLNITDDIQKTLNLSADDVFAYIYAVLHSPEYKEKYANDLKKDFPRIPILKNKEEFVRIGHELINLHLNYEKVEPCSSVDIEFLSSNPSFFVKKMRFPKRNQKETIIFNSDIKIKDIPAQAYEYIVNGRSAIEWIIDQYQVIEDKKTGIIDNPNEYSGDSKYVFNLLLSIINLSVQTVDLVNGLPKLEIVSG